MKRLIQALAEKCGYVIQRRREPSADLDAYVQQQRLTASVPAPVILDVGAYNGATCRQYAQLFPRATIHAFEPFPESFAALVANTDDLPQVTAHNLAVFNAPGTAPMNANSFAPTNSLLQTDDRGVDSWGDNLLETQEQITCQVTTVDQFMAENGLDHIDILKMDVQGGEYRVLEGAAAALAEGRIGLIYMEIITVPTYVGQWDLKDYLSYLRDRNMQLHGFYNLDHARGRLCQLDAIFVRSAE